MDKTGRIVLIVGATGQQGDAVTRHLLADGWQVHALTRDPSGKHRPEPGGTPVRTSCVATWTTGASLTGAYGVNQGTHT